ncbi:MAG TPA: sensor domain-containing diguanylate cyclase [Anaeromyxobacteraceae bacterium]|nr:sensor domain-containing diguanylate cyclase [Anaeromyxobacteraceae bacterium]
MRRPRAVPARPSLRERIEAQRRPPALARARGALFREAGLLGRARRRRALRLLLGSVPAAAVAACTAFLWRDDFGGTALGWPQAATGGLLLLALGGAVLRQARASAAGRAGTTREHLELGALFVVVAHLVARTAGGGAEGPLQPVVYLVMAFLVSFLPRRVGLLLVGFAVGLEALAWQGRGAPREELPAVAARAGFVVLFAALYHAVLWAQLAASRRAERSAVQRRLREIEERAREFRLLAPGSGGEGGGDRDRRMAEASVVEIEAAVRGALEVAEAALRSHTAAVYLLTADDAWLVLRECRSRSERVAPRLPAGEGALGGVVARAAAVRLAGEVRSGSYYEDGTRPRALLATPLVDRRGGHVRGVLLADRVEDLPFGEEDEALLGKLAAELVRAVAAERLMADLQRARDEKDRFYAAIERLNRTAKPREVFDATLQVAASMVPVDFGAVTVVEGGEGRATHRVARVSLEAGEGRTPPLEGVSFPDNGGLVAAAVKLGSTLPGREIRIPEALVFDGRTRLKGLESLRIFPLKAGEQVLGTLVLGSRRREAYGRDAVRQLEVIALQAGDALLRARLFAETEKLATTDGLTGVANHRTFQARLDEHLLASQRYGKRLSLILCDIDHFKSVNDTYGHPVGDQVLRGVARALLKEARATDLTARYGGEEFAVVMPETDAAGGRIIAERIREKVGALSFATELGSLRVTVSLGVATFPDDGRRKAELVELCDACLYHAKRSGRNRTVTSAQLRPSRRASGAGRAG